MKYFKKFLKYFSIKVHHICENDRISVNKKKMLVVDDDILSQNVMRGVFRDDFEIDFCESVEVYYEKYSIHKFDIIIMDIALKGDKNGLDLIKEIKSAATYSGTPIICLTAHAEMKTRNIAIESGTDLFITKPVHNGMLKDAVVSLVKK